MQLASVNAGQTIDFEQISLTLPSNGSYSYGFIRPDTGANPQLVVCDTQTKSTIYVDGRTGQETARRLGSDLGAANLNQVRAGARTRTATSSSVSPPNTGDGGLATDGAGGLPWWVTVLTLSATLVAATVLVRAARK